MKTCIWGLLVFLVGVSSRADLNTKLSEELLRSQISTTILRTTLPNRHFVLWGGIKNELIRGYFKHNVESLQQDFYVSKISMYMPSSLKTITEVAEESYLNLLNLYVQGGNKPLVIFAHSKGGPEAVLSMIIYPELIKLGIVDRVVSIQGAIGGSPLSDIYENALKPISPILTRLILSWIDQGAESLVRLEADQTFNYALSTLTVDNKKLLSSRIFYVRSQQSGKAVFRGLKVLAALVNPYGVNDGMVLTEDMYRTDFGIDLGVLDADHNDFVASTKRSNQTAKFKYAFTRALCREIYEYP